MHKEDTGVRPPPVKEPQVNTNTSGRRVDKLLSVLEKESLLGMVILFVMMMLTVADVVGRYFFNHPVQGTNEITGLLLVLVAASALAFSQIKKGHIRVDLITQSFISQRPKYFGRDRLLFLSFRVSLNHLADLL